MDLQQLHRLVHRRHSFLLHGPAGVGKTLLLKSLLSQFGGILYCDESSSSQIVFRRLAIELLARKAHCVVQVCGKAGAEALKVKSAVAIRGIVAEALRAGSYWIVLDHLKAPSQSFATALKDVCKWSETPLIVAARSAHMEDVGFLLPLFSQRSEKYELRNFDVETATSFALATAEAMQLRPANLSDVVQKIVLYGKGNPGAICAMLKMAASPRYVTEQHVKLSPLYIDFCLQWGISHA